MKFQPFNFTFAMKSEKFVTLVRINYDTHHPPPLIYPPSISVSKLPLPAAPRASKKTYLMIKNMYLVRNEKNTAKSGVFNYFKIVWEIRKILGKMGGGK